MDYTVRTHTTIICVLPMTEAKVESKDADSDSEEQARGADSSPALSSQPQRIALFPGMDPSALKVSLTCAFVKCIHH